MAADALSVAQHAMRLYAAGDLDELRGLVHPDAEIQMLLLDGEAARGPDGLVQALRAAARSVHSPIATRFEAVDRHAAIMVGRIRHEAGRGWVDRPAAWLTVLREGLIWRARVFGTPAEARSVYARELLPVLDGSGRTG